MAAWEPVVGAVGMWAFPHLFTCVGFLVCLRDSVTYPVYRVSEVQTESSITQRTPWGCLWGQMSLSPPALGHPSSVRYVCGFVVPAMGRDWDRTACNFGDRPCQVAAVAVVCSFCG